MRANNGTSNLSTFIFLLFSASTGPRFQGSYNAWLGRATIVRNTSRPNDVVIHIDAQLTLSNEKAQEGIDVTRIQLARMHGDACRKIERGHYNDAVFFYSFARAGQRAVAASRARQIDNDRPAAHPGNSFFGNHQRRAAARHLGRRYYHVRGARVFGNERAAPRERFFG
jgi:hypothetical protein